jgi:hypothetical protein
MPTPDTPADTTMMRIVHDALRRDLDRARTTLAQPAEVSRARRRAIGGHLRWMMRFLDAHHRSEDEGLYPLVRAHAGDDVVAREVLDRMAHDHEAVAVAATDLDAAAATMAAEPSDEASHRVVVAIDALTAVLLPHLRAEEDEAMPLTSKLITNAEWQAIEKERNLDPISTSDLAFEGHWLIDGATAEDRATVLGLVPPIPRYIMLYGLARRYRRHAKACWGRVAKPPRRVQLENGVTVTVDTDIDAVWAVVRDPTRVGEWSHECVGAAWMGDATAAAPGARFRGRNRAGAFRWGRVCEVLAAEPYELVWRTVPTTFYPDSSEWRITLERAGTGTTVAESFRVVRAPKVLGVLYALMIPAHRDRTNALVDDLQRLGDVAGKPTQPRAQLRRS